MIASVARGDELVPPAARHQDRRRPAHLDVARHAPGFLAGLLVEADDEGLLAVVLVALQDHELVVEHRRGADADAEARDPAALPAPLQRAVEPVDVEALGPEVRVDQRAVRDRRRRGEAAALVARVVGGALPGGLLPQDLARLRVERQHRERLLAVGAHAVGMLEVLALHQVLDGLGAGHHVALDRRREEDAVAPDHGRRVPAPRDLRGPDDVLGRAPLERYGRVLRDAEPVRTAPLRPMRRRGCERRSRGREGGERAQ